MKKILVVVSAVMVALVIFGAGFFFAQTNVVSAAGLPVGYGPGGMSGGRGGMMGGVSGGRGAQGQIQDYVEQALADKLGMTKTEVETALSSGKSMYQIALDKGTKEADFTVLLTDVHKTAIAKAVSDGVLTQAQADTMLQNMTANGFNYSGSPMQNGGAAGRGARGGRGPGGMMGGWNQQSTTTP